ncbi:MAG: hypothetical protein LOY03_16305 [Cyclobacteriaceae bacterium]|nr:hypothetical protein [Cyclobacteriaceae bacterium]
MQITTPFRCVILALFFVWVCSMPVWSLELAHDIDNPDLTITNLDNIGT